MSGPKAGIVKGVLFGQFAELARGASTGEHFGRERSAPDGVTVRNELEQPIDSGQGLSIAND